MHEAWVLEELGCSPQWSYVGSLLFIREVLVLKKITPKYTFKEYCYAAMLHS
jgi:hypothetical protein